MRKKISGMNFKIYLILKSCLISEAVCLFFFGVTMFFYEMMVRNSFKSVLAKDRCKTTL